MTDLLNSIRTKIVQSERVIPGPDPEILEAKRTNAEKLKAVLPAPPSTRPTSKPAKPANPAEPRRITRKRKVTRAKGRVVPAVTIAAWVNERLIQAPECCEYLGVYQRHTVIKVNGVPRRSMADYRRVTLREDYARFCQQKNFPPAGKGNPFTANLLVVLNDLGWPTRLDRSHRERRGILWGVCLRDQRGWRGNETTL